MRLPHLFWRHVDDHPRTPIAIAFTMEDFAEMGGYTTVLVRWSPETGQVAKRESLLGAAGGPKVRHDQYSKETRS